METVLTQVHTAAADVLTAEEMKAAWKAAEQEILFDFYDKHAGDAQTNIDLYKKGQSRLSTTKLSL